MIVHRMSMEPEKDGKEVKITIWIPLALIGASTQRSLRAWFGEMGQSPKRLIKLVEQVMSDEETYRNLPQWNLNDVCEKCGRPNVQKEETDEEKARSAHVRTPS